MQKRFTLAEAQRLVPEVDRLLSEAVELKTEFDGAEQAQQSFTEKVMMMGGVVVDRTRALERRKAREEALAKLRSAIERVQELGCVVKDLDTGLVDFPTVFRGEDVYLCWKLGEPAIEFWHRIEDGFRGRKAIDADFLANHHGESEE